MEQELALPDWAAELPGFAQQAVLFGLEAFDQVLIWLQSPAAWSQFGLLVAAFILAVVTTRIVSPRLTQLLTPRAENVSAFANAMRLVAQCTPLLLPLFAYAYTAIGEEVTRTIFDSAGVIAFGKRVFLLLAARILVEQVISEGFIKLLGRYILMPIMAIYTFGLLDVALAYLNDTRVVLGNISFSLMDLLRGLVAGSILFWLGSWSNEQSADYIKRQEEMRPSLRELVTKVIEFMIFGIAFLILMNIMGVNLSALAVLGGAIGVGLGFGLQKIASNFISGVILLVEGQATVGDYVELDGGEAGTIVRMMMRAAILETFDGRWIVVPNEDFITTRVVNYSDSGSANRYEAPFSVSYDTDINLVPPLVEAAVAQHPEVLDLPFPPDCELRAFGESGIEFAVEFWVNGLDDGANKFTSDVLFIIWNCLRDNGIKIPYPQRVVEIKGRVPDLAE